MRLRTLFAALAGAAFLAAPALAHRTHAGVTEITVNPRTGELEIMHRVYAHDLMDAMGRDDVAEADFFASEEGLAEVGEHVAGQFRIGASDGRLYAPGYVGAELDGEFAWVYYAMPAPDDVSGFLVDNDILSEHFDDQIMMTNFRINSLVRTAMQGPGQRDPVRISFE